MDRKLKVLFVNKFLFIKGGAETYVFNLANYLREQGHTAEFFGMDHCQNMVSSNLNLNVRNMDFHGTLLKKLLYPFKIIYSIEARRKIKRIIRNIKPDIIHLNNYNFQITPSILYEIKKHNIPVIMTLHDFQLICPNHMLYIEHKKEVCEECKGRKYSSCIKHKCIHNSRLKSIMGTLEAKLYYKLGTYEKNIDSYIAPSYFMKNKVVEFGEQENKITVIHNFISGEEYTGRRRKEKYVLYFGRLAVQKGIHTLIEVCRRLPHICFVIAGSGEMAGQLKGIDNIKYVGYKNREELKPLIEGAVFSVCPSVCYENCSMSIIESQMYGTPVIGANIGGIPELIEDGKDGLLFNPGDAGDLSEKIRFLYENETLLETFSANCAEKIRCNFSIERYYEELMKVYSVAIEKHRSCKQIFSKTEHVIGGDNIYEGCNDRAKGHSLQSGRDRSPC